MQLLLLRLKRPRFQGMRLLLLTLLLTLSRLSSRLRPLQMPRQSSLQEQREGRLTIDPLG